MASNPDMDPLRPEVGNVTDDFSSGRISRRIAMTRLALLGMGTAAASALIAACDRPSDSGGTAETFRREGGSVGGRLTVYPARKVITMTESMPDAGAVAVADGRIVAVGSMDSLRPWLDAHPHDVDDSLADKVVMPGLIDAHVHPSLPAVLTRFPFLAPDDWTLPTGVFPGVRTPAEYLERLDELVAAHRDPKVPFITWGYHPLWHGELDRTALTARYRDRPVMLWHRSFHELYVNDAALGWLGVREDQLANHPEVAWARGHFWENGFQAMLAVSALPGLLFDPAGYRQGMITFLKMLQQAGVTTALDMGVGTMSPSAEEIDLIREVAESTNAPARIVLTPLILDFLSRKLSPEEAVAESEERQRHNSRRVQFDRHFKLMMDGAIFSGLAQIGTPGYLDGHAGLWMVPLETTRTWAEAFWKAGYQIHAHTNGDLSADALIDLVRHLMATHPRTDHRTVLEHFAYTTEDQNRQLKQLGMLVSANPHYTFLLSDIYSEQWLGTDRGSQMVRLGSLERLGVPFALHSDCPMGPLSPLTLAWAASNRITVNGNVACPPERISLQAALRAVTIDAAWIMRKENDIGSIRAGKYADFAVLEDDPYEAGIDGLKDVKVWGTVFEGELHPVKP